MSGAPAAAPSGAQSWRRKRHLGKLQLAAQQARLHALDVVHVAEDARDRLRLVAAGVAHRVADQVDRPAVQPLAAAAPPAASGTGALPLTCGGSTSSSARS